MKEIHKSKLTVNMVMVTDANGYPTASSLITVNELNTLNNYDGKGYIFARLGAVETNSVKKSSSWGMPDYSAGVSLTKGTTVVPVDAIGVLSIPATGGTKARVKVNGVSVLYFYHTSNQSLDGGDFSFIIPKDSTVEIVDEYSANNTLSAMYYPLIKE